jgi:hypothetical protein
MNTICIKWETNRREVSWSNLCASVVEQFGLPGGRYQTEVCEDWMSFHFHNDKDAFMCKVLLSEYL